MIFAARDPAKSCLTEREDIPAQSSPRAAYVIHSFSHKNVLTVFNSGMISHHFRSRILDHVAGQIEAPGQARVGVEARWRAEKGFPKHPGGG